MMRTLLVPAADGCAGARVVLLPGAFDTPERFVAAGFDAAVRARGLPLDLQFVALELKSVTDRDMVERLHAEVLLPARRAGYRHLWLGGISFGAFLALTLAARHGRDIDGLCLLAPYLGSRLVTNEIAAAQSLARWAEGAGPTEDEDRNLWRFIAAGHGKVPIWLGLGRHDRFLDRHQLLASALPSSAVRTVAGGHDWPTWRQLWDNFLDVWTTPTYPGGTGSPPPC
jgi:pimeloyl-ACP methyl ester carboxylesterase